jgi:hypothetical protein
MLKTRRVICDAISTAGELSGHENMWMGLPIQERKRSTGTLTMKKT